MDGAPVAGPSKPQMSKPKAPAQDDLLDIDRVLAMEDSAVSRELEVERVLAAFKLNPYAILDFSPSAGAFPTLEEIKKRYRQRSLLIHPDKIKHERGVEAFDLLKKASTELEDEKKRKDLDQVVLDGRMLVCRELGAPDQAPDDHPKLRALAPDVLQKRIAAKINEIITEDDRRRQRVRQMTMIAEGAEAQRKEKEEAEKLAKIQKKRQWEDTREDRVTDWRAFQTGSKKKAKKGGYLG